MSLNDYNEYGFHDKYSGIFRIFIAPHDLYHHFYCLNFALSVSWLVGMIRERRIVFCAL